METIICVCGAHAEIIELFDYHVLVQDIETGALFLVEYQQIDQEQEAEYTQPDVQESNVISLKGWHQWQKKAKNLKSISQDTSRSKKKRQPLPSPKPNLLQLKLP